VLDNSKKSPGDFKLRRDRSADNSFLLEFEVGADVNDPLVQIMRKVLKVNSINEIKR
jgi:hypothetical protein